MSKDTYIEDSKFSRDNQHLIEDVYEKNGYSLVERYGDDNKLDLDKYLHIDAKVRYKELLDCSFQEKLLRHKFSHYHTFTMEYKQNWRDNTNGEFFHIQAQCYFHGYVNKKMNGIDKWAIIDVRKFREWVIDKRLLEYKRNSGCPVNINKPLSQNASFLHIKYNLIPEDLIIKSYNIYEGYE
jgi:hypothetical protein